MFFAIAALIVSAIEIAVGVWIGLSVAKYRRSQPVAAQRALDFVPSPPMSSDDSESSGSEAPRSYEAVPSELIHANKVATAESDKVAAADAPVHSDDIQPQKAPPARQPVTAPVTQSSGAERRASARRPFAFRQHVAPYHGGSLPGKASFREVECQDISSTGFSFLSSQLPDFDSLVVALGAPPRLTYLQAQIVNRFPVHDGMAPLYRIGCRFAGQVVPW